LGRLHGSAKDEGGDGWAEPSVELGHFRYPPSINGETLISLTLCIGSLCNPSWSFEPGRSKEFSLCLFEQVSSAMFPRAKGLPEPKDLCERTKYHSQRVELPCPSEVTKHSPCKPNRPFPSF
jgi:hypothetical protein